MHILLAFALLLGTGAEASTTKKSAVPNRFGAIAYHRATNSWGVSFDMVRSRDADVAALRQCGQRECEVIHRFKNGCAALAEGPKAGVAASGATRDEAETKALRKCGDGCKPLAWGCTR